MTLCDKCKQAINDAPSGNGVCITICPNCDLNDVDSYIRKSCLKTGCKHLVTTCKDCGRVVNTMEFKDGD